MDDFCIIHTNVQYENILDKFSFQLSKAMVKIVLASLKEIVRTLNAFIL